MHPMLVIWWLAVGLLAAALIWLVQLILARRFREASAQRHARERRRIRDALIGLAMGERGDYPILAPGAAALPVVADQLAQLAEVLRGPELDRVAEALRAQGLYDQLAARARTGKKWRRPVFIEALGVFSGDDTTGVLSAIARGPDQHLALLAWKALWRLGEPVSLADVVPANLAARDQTLDRVELAALIAEARPLEALPYLDNDEVGEEIRLRLVEAISASGWTGTAAALGRLATEAMPPSIRAAAIRGLARLSCGSVDRLLSSALADPSWEVRAEAATAVAASRASTQLERLGDLLDDDVWLVRYNAGRALLAMSVGGRRRLEHIARSGALRPRRAAAFLLSAESPS